MQALRLMFYFDLIIALAFVDESDGRCEDVVPSTRNPPAHGGNSSRCKDG